MRVVSTKSIGHDSLKMLVFGQSGSGKTTLCSTIGEPTLILSAESGLLSIAHADCDVIELQTDDNGAVLPKEKRIERLMSVYKFLCKPETRAKYKWICIDSLTEIGQNLFEKLKQEYPDRKDGLVLWGEYSQQMRAIIKAFRDLPGYNVLFTALAIENRDDNGKKNFSIDLSGKIAQQLPQYFDEVLFLHVRKDQDDTNIRALLCLPNEVVPYVKDRSGKLSQIEVPNIKTITTKIRGKK